MTRAAAVVKRIGNAKVAAVFRAYPSGVAVKLRALRRLIFAVASKSKDVGELEETLKWGQPSYVTARSGSGSTIRIGQVKARDGRYAMYFHCQTTLVDTFRRLYPHTFRYEGNRAILFDEHDEVPVHELSHCIALALTYRLAKARRA
jgi:hypothetical protein